MDIRDHHALSTGLAPLPDGRQVQLAVVGLGDLSVESGRLGACDPFAYLYDPVVLPVPPGRHPVFVTVADVSEAQDGSHRREAYLSVVFSEAASTVVEPAPNEGGAPEDGLAWGVGVDAGTVGFVDADAIDRCMPGDGSDWYSDVFDTGGDDGWFAQMDADSPYPAGTANIPLPLAADGENVVLSRSGWGDGFFPLLRTLAADGMVTAIHIDLLVVGAPEEETAEEETAGPDEATPVAQEPEPAAPGTSEGWLRRLFGGSGRTS
ncbi:DUF4241 domain-containing protein [Leifsonia shinshuensis]|uniref:DUF4241 domain-containing protein n=1 Tax=Leifsonia shinshuensis TaxID=150026 RepID=UPI001F50503E|nr:DUF4241 domain-containing protein [Leifsonia shinshuensis]MCI0155112.1 DUF4241 domain-containing protein [Leifsonia shinshuensis]